MSEIIPFESTYTPPWEIVPCQTFAGMWAIRDAEGQVAAVGLTKTMADDWKQQLDTTGFIDHEP